MIQRRLLMGGGGSFVQPPEAFSVVDVPDAGGWTEVAGPHAYYASGKTYITWVTGNSDPNDTEIIARSDGAAPDTYAGPILLANNLGGTGVADSHLGPAVIIRPDGKAVVAYCAHYSGTITVKIGNTAGDITAGFSSPININVSAIADATYPQLSYLTSNDRIYLTWRWSHTTVGPNSGFGLTYSDDGGLTWDAPIAIFEAATNLVYGCFASNGVDRIDFAMTDGPPDQVGGYGLWHWYIDEAGDPFKSDGSSIAGSYPLATSDLTQVVADTGDHYPYSLSYQADGKPVIAWQTKTATPIAFGEKRWTGSAWTSTQIDTSELLDGTIESIGGGAHDWNDSERFIHGKVVSGVNHVYLYTRSGGVWTGRSIATATCAPSPVYVMNAGSEVSWLWFSAGFTDSDTFDPGLAGVA